MHCCVIRPVCLVFQAERRPEEFGLPEMVQHYHSLFPLEDLQAAAEQPSGAFGVCTALVRAASPQLQGQAVTLRRLDPRQVSCNTSIYSQHIVILSAYIVHVSSGQRQHHCLLLTLYY